MSKKYLVYRNDVYEPRFNVAERDIEIALDTTELEIGTVEDPSTTTILTKERTLELLNEEITSAAQYVGDIDFLSLFELQTIMNDFNQGVPILLKDGRTYGKVGSGADDEAMSGDTLLFVPQNAGFATETVFITTEIEMILTTNNNTTNNSIQFIQNDINALQQDKLDIINRGVFLSLDGDNEMSPGYAPITNQAATTKVYVDEANLVQDGHINSNESRITTIENVISGGVDIEVGDAKLTWTGLEQGTGTTSEVSFTLPLSANVLSPGLSFDYTDGQTLEIGISDSADTTGHVSTVSFTVGQGLEENMYFKDAEIAVVGMVSAANPGELILTSVGNGNKDITDTLRLVKVNQITSFSGANLATKAELLLKQDAIDNALQTTTTSVVGAINELKLRTDGLLDEVVKSQNFNTMFSINYGYEEGIGITQGDMFTRLLQFISDGRLKTGSSVAVRFRNVETGAIENCTNAEIISYTPQAGTVMGVVSIGLDLWVDGNENYQKGILNITQNSQADAQAVVLDRYVFAKDAHDIGDHKWSYNGTLEGTDPSHGWVRMDGRSTVGMSQEAIDVFGASIPNALNGSLGRFIRAVSTNTPVGLLQNDATAVNSMSANQSSHRHASGIATRFDNGETQLMSMFDSYREGSTHRVAPISSNSYAAGASWSSFTDPTITLFSSDIETRPTSVAMYAYIWVGY